MNCNNFKVGDWVENIREVNQRIIKQVVDCKEHLDTLTVGNATNGVNVILKSDIRLWQPKQGEWCWFSNGSHLVLARISRTENDEFITIDTDMVGNCYYKYCEPFLGELPSFLK